MKKKQPARTRHDVNEYWSVTVHRAEKSGDGLGLQAYRARASICRRDNYASRDEVFGYGGAPSSAARNATEAGDTRARELGRPADWQDWAKFAKAARRKAVDYRAEADRIRKIEPKEAASLERQATENERLAEQWIAQSKDDAAAPPPARVQMQDDLHSGRAKRPGLRE